MTNACGNIVDMQSGSSRAILAANLRKLIDHATPEGEKTSVRGWALARGLDVRLIDRLVKGENAVTLDSLEKIADACGLKPWHLLYEDFDPAKPPAEPISADDLAAIRRVSARLGM